VKAEIDRGRVDDAGLGFTYRYDTRGVGLDPSSGIAVIYNQSFGGLAGDAGAYSKSTIRTVGERAIINEDVVLRGILEGGLLHHTKGSSRVTDRFFLPATILRGFEYAGMGPRQQSNNYNDALGGNKYAVAKFEVDFPLGLPEEYGMSGGAFYHVGNLWDTGASSGVDDLFYDNGAWRHVVGATLFGPRQSAHCGLISRAQFKNKHTTKNARLIYPLRRISDARPSRDSSADVCNLCFRVTCTGSPAKSCGDRGFRTPG
jgi:outer membrane protein insertion porin family